jgi:hypothetical protein
LLGRELDERLGFSALITENIMDDRHGRTLSCRSMIAGARDEPEIGIQCSSSDRELSARRRPTLSTI